MTAVATQPSVSRAMQLLDEAVAALTGSELVRLTEDELLEVLRRVEAHRRRLAAVDHALIGELETRRTAERVGARCTTALLRDLLRVSPREAAGRVRAAARLGPRESISGECWRRSSRWSLGRRRRG